MTPVNTALELQDESLLDLLIEKGVDLNYFNKNLQYPPIVVAALKSEALLQKLISAGADINIAIRNNWGPLDFGKLP